MTRFIFLFLALATANFLPLNAQDSDYAAIEEAVSYYLDGGTNNDFATLSKAFHPSATMRYIGSDGYREVNALDFFRKGTKPGPPQQRETSVQQIIITGHAAHAVLRIKYPTFQFLDHMTLLKIDGEWKIVSKVFYREALDTE